MQAYPASCILAAVAFLGACESKRAPLAGPVLPRHPAMQTSSSDRPASEPLPPGHPAISPAGAEAGFPPPAGAAGPMAPDVPAAAGDVELGRTVAVGPVSLTAPEGWVRLPTTSQFTAALFQLPRAEGDSEDGKVTVSAAGGTLEANVQRWQAQFKENPPADTETKEIAGMKVVSVTLAGTFQGGGMAGAGGDRPGWKMRGAVIEVPGQREQVFVKALGPAKTMDRWEKSFVEFLGSLVKAQ